KRRQSDCSKGCHQQRGSDRAVDERLREVHGASPDAATWVDVIDTGALLCSLYWPSVTTRSPSATPVVTTVRLPLVASTWILRGCAIFPSVTIHVNSPCGPRCTAIAGTTSALGRVSRRTRALTNDPGHRASSSLANIAFKRTVAVA